MKAISADATKPVRSRPWVLVIVVTGFLAGCLAPFRTPSDVAHVRLSTADSASVIVDKVWLERPEGSPLTLTGYVIRRQGADDTTATRLEISLLDVSGRSLHTTRVDFEPRQIPRRYRPPAATAVFRHVIGALPGETTAISVTAVDGL